MVLGLLQEDQVWRVGTLEKGLIYMIYLVIYLACAVMRSNAWKCISK